MSDDFTCHLSVAAQTAYEISRLLGEWRVAGNTLHDRSSARRTLSNHGHRLLEDQVIGRSGSESGGVVDRLDDPGRLDVGTTGRARALQTPEGLLRRPVPVRCGRS